MPAGRPPTVDPASDRRADGAPRNPLEQAVLDVDFRHDAVAANRGLAVTDALVAALDRHAAIGAGR